MTKPQSNKLILGEDPEHVFPVPRDDEFGDAEFIPAEPLRKIGNALIGARLCFKSLRPASIVYLWKRKGPIKPRLLGKCQRPSGLLDYFSQAHFVVWLAANNCMDLTNWQIEALLFHELSHSSIDADGKAVSVPHDWEGFAEEIQRYGLWRSDMVPIGEAVAKTLKLPFPESPPPLGKIARDFIASQPDGIGRVTILTPGSDPVVITPEDVQSARALVKAARASKAAEGRV